MPSTTASKRGDVVLVSFPFTDLTSTKRRPALVFSPDTLNLRNEDLILIAVTSQLVPLPYSVHPMPADCEEGALPKESTIGLTKVFTLSSALIVRKLCRLNERKFIQVMTGFRDLFA